MPGGNKSLDILKEPLPSFVLKNVVLKENLYCKVENYLKSIINIKNLILRILRIKNIQKFNIHEY